MPKKKPGWYGESQRHALAAKGVKTGTKDRKKDAKRVVRPTDSEHFKESMTKYLDADEASKAWVRKNRDDDEQMEGVP